MSAIVLTSLGQAAGGPLGALTGSLVGNVIDRALAGGASAADPTVLRATYGTIIPMLFGCNRTAGAMVWAQPMRRAGGGKGGGQRSYVASFAIALSTRRVQDIGRIWADGREIRGADQTSEFPLSFRLRSAGEAHGPDPLIAAAEGTQLAPGYAGLSVIVFEDFPLGPFGNRIPALEFEVLADRDDSSAGSWLVEAVDGSAADGALDTERALVGWPLVNAVLRQDLDGAMRAAGLVVGERHGRLCVQYAGKVHLLRRADLLFEDGEPALVKVQRTALRAMSAAVSYADVDRDYLEGEQQVFQAGTGEALRQATPIAMRSAVARSLATAMLSQDDSLATTLTLALSFRHLNVALGDRIRFEEEANYWIVVARSVENFRIRIECAPWRSVTADRPGDSGRIERIPVSQTAARRLVILEIPDRLGTLQSDSILVGVSAPDQWAGAELFVDDGALAWPLGYQQTPLLVGTLAAPLYEGPETIWDDKNGLMVRLDDADAWPESRSAEAVLAGANLVRCGEEILSFRDVEPVEIGLFRLSGLLRARMGTQPAAPFCEGGADIVFMNPAGLTYHRMVADHVGRNLDVTARSMLRELTESYAFLGLGHAPLRACHVRFARYDDGSVHISWIGRDRAAFDWAGAEAVGAAASYVIEVWRDDALVFSRRLFGHECVVLPSEQIAASGQLWADLKVRIVSDGVGPLRFRTSDWAMLG